MKSLPEIAKTACAGGPDALPVPMVVVEIATERIVPPPEPASVVVKGFSFPSRGLGERRRIVGSG
jgi:hypothetical protein